MTTTTDLLPVIEQEALDRCEAIIARGVQTFIDVGEALAEIRDAKLYRTHYDTWEEYCTDRWGIGRARAYQLITAAVVTREMSTVVDNPPTNEREARAIAKAAPADRPKVIERATELAGDQPRTAKHIEQAAAEIAPAPALDDILLRLDAHGYAKTTTREKGGATLYSFRDYSGRSDDTGGEIELAEGELGYWLDELDTSAAYAQAKQERFIDAQGRAEALGYDLRRDGSQFELTPAGKRVPAMRGTLDQLIKTIEGYEKNAAKQAAPDDQVPHLPLDFTQAQKRAAKIGLLVAMDMHGTFSIKNERGSGVDQIAEWESLLRHLAYSEQAAAEIAAERSGHIAPIAKEPIASGWWNCGMPKRAMEAAVNHSDRNGALHAALDLVRLFAGDDPKRRVSALLLAIEREMKGSTTDDQEGLSQAISDLNECEEGTEVQHWLKVGYALLDLEAEDA